MQFGDTADCKSAPQAIPLCSTLLSLLKESCFTPRVLAAAVAVWLAGVAVVAAQEGNWTGPVPEGYMVVEGDILVKVEGHAPKGIFRPTTTYYWTGGTVPYEWDANVSNANKTNMLNAMQVWQDVANVHFVARNGESDYVHIKDGNGNLSQVGRVGGRQDITIYNWNMRITMAHELGHTLGFWHEHTRADRGPYIQINNGNIQADYQNQFTIHAEASHYGPYDFDSLMHYDKCAFSTDCAAGFTCACTNLAITVLAPYTAQWQDNIGQRNHLSQWDGIIMSYLYPQSDWRFVDPYYSGTEAGTFLNPYTAFASAEASVPGGGKVVLLQPGTYSATGHHSKAMTLVAPQGGVVLR
jgi:hypothetical protein